MSQWESQSPTVYIEFDINGERFETTGSSYSYRTEKPKNWTEVQKLGDEPGINRSTTKDDNGACQTT